MPKCYIFSIGGSGSRVLECITYLFAAGVTSNRQDEFKYLSDYEFVPVILDLDETNGNKSRVDTLLKTYLKIQDSFNKDSISDNTNDFFGTRISTLNSVLKVGSYDDFVYPFSFDGDTTLKDIIDYTKLNVGTRNLVDLLYTSDSFDTSRNHLTMDLKVGFKGAPHIGAVVLNKLSDQEGENMLRNICTQLDPKDKIFIIGSSFGGTGAAGAPLLARIIKEASHDVLPNQKIREEIPIGCLSIMPYFSVKDETGAVIKSETFMLKTKAAMHYYSNESHFNTTYYVGADGQSTQYDYSEGGKDQNNESHIVDLIGALSLFHFLGRPAYTKKESFEFATDNHTPTLRNFDHSTLALFKKPLINFFFLTAYLKHQIASDSNSSLLASEKLKFKKVISSAIFSELESFCNLFMTWLEDIQNQKHMPRAEFFGITDFGNPKYNPLDLVNGFSIKKPKLNIFKKGDFFKEFSKLLNEAIKDSKFNYEKFGELQAVLIVCNKAGQELLKTYSNEFDLH